jgi:hypothetical protein
MERYDDKGRKKRYAELVLGDAKSKLISSVLFDLYDKQSTQGLTEKYLKSLDYKKFSQLEVGIYV